MPKPYNVPTIDEYLRQRLMPVEGAIPHIPGIEMFGDSIPAGTVGGDLFEYINFQQRYDIDARIERAKRLAIEYLEPLPAGAAIRNSVDDQVEWLQARPEYDPAMEAEYRFARSAEQLRVAEDLHELYETAGVLIVDAQGHGIIPAKIASTVHDTFHALMLTELDRYGRTTPRLFENLNLRMAQSLTARNALGMSETEQTREIATMLYGEIHPGGSFRFANFGHPPPLVFSGKCARLLDVHDDHMAQYLALGLQLPADHPDLRRYFSMNLRTRRIFTDDIAEINLINRGDILILYTDGVYDGSDAEGRVALEKILQARRDEPARNICDALMEYALMQDEVLRMNGDEALIDDKTVLVVKRT
jgi:serine phosphatase RsbU (regulator of sigma subunit)